MSKTILHKSESRGDKNHGWLHSRHTFSFANYYNPERMHFGVLGVLNDDHVAEGMGFGIWDTDKIPLKADSQDAEVLLMEVPMNL